MRKCSGSDSVLRTPKEIRRKHASAGRIGLGLYMGAAESGADMGLDLESELGARMGSFVDGELWLKRDPVPDVSHSRIGRASADRLRCRGIEP